MTAEPPGTLQHHPRGHHGITPGAAPHSALPGLDLPFPESLQCHWGPTTVAGVTGVPSVPLPSTHLPHEEDEEGEEQEPSKGPQHHPLHRHSPLAPGSGANHLGDSLQRTGG